MQAFITGASGFIGSHLLESLIKKNWKVRVLVHRSQIPLEGNFEMVKGNLGDFSLLSDALEGTDILFHLAASLGSSLINKNEFFRINAQGTENILKAAQAAGVKRTIHFSSAGVLGSVKENEVAAEDYPLNPQNVYDQSKLEGERIALRFAQEGLNLIMVRPGWAYGPGDRRTFKLIKMIHNQRFFMVTKGKGRQTPVYINDLVRGILLCVEKGRAGEIYHLAGEEILTIKEIVEGIAVASGKRIPQFSLPLFPAKIAAWILEKTFSPFKKEAPLNMSRLSFFIHSKPMSIAKAKKELGYSPEVNFRTGINLAVSWYKQHGWL
jgi:dihydroflavonol-4-reductase